MDTLPLVTSTFGSIDNQTTALLTAKNAFLAIHRLSAKGTSLKGAD